MTSANGQKDIDVLGFGMIVYDVFARPLDVVPDWGRLVTFDEIAHNVGGCPVNTAVDLARLGARAMIGGCVGDDPAGKIVRERIAESGVLVGGITAIAGFSTAYTFIAIGSDGRRRYFHTVGANARLSDSYCTDDMLRRAKILHIGGTLLHPGFDGEPTARLLRRAKALGLTTAIDTAFNPGANAAALMKPCYPYLDIFIPSIEEAELITGKTDPGEILDALDGHGIPIVGIKLGAEGSVIRAEGRTVLTPAFDVRPVDTTGAGDAFMAGFLYGTLRDWPVERRARFATAVAAMCIQAVGCSTNIPAADTVLDFLEKSERVG